MGLYDLTFYDVIVRNARIFGEREAWSDVDGGTSQTFLQIRERVDRLAAGLRARGVTKGDRLGILAKNSLEYFLLYGAAAALGAIVLPVNWRLSAEEVFFNLNDCSPSLLFVDPEFQGMFSGGSGNLPSIRGMYGLSGKAEGFPPLEGLMDARPMAVPEEVSTDDGFVIIHTAAVAGRPRGALLSHGNVLCASMQFAFFFGYGPEDVHLSILPLFHVGGLFMATTAFLAGALNLNMSKFDAARALDLIEKRRVSVMFDFAPILGSILDEQERTGKAMGSLRAVAGLEAAATIERYQQKTGGTFFSMYGQTETSCVATFGAYSTMPGSAGKTLPLAQVRVVDEEDQDSPVGEVGEIVMKGPMVFKGYWGLPEDTAYAFRGGWHHTGDTGRFDGDGFLWYAGRKPDKELIKPGGENVYPAEVERVILQHPAIARTVVFGVPDPKWKEGIKAVCECRPGMSVEALDLIAFVGERIARYKKPQVVQFVETLPLLKDGLPDRARVKQLYGEPS